MSKPAIGTCLSCTEPLKEKATRRWLLAKQFNGLNYLAFLCDFFLPFFLAMIR